MIAMSKSLVLLAAFGSKAFGTDLAATTGAAAPVGSTLVDVGGLTVTTQGEASSVDGTKYKWEAPVAVPTAAPVIVVPPSDVVCPQMTAFSSGTYLHMPAWSFLRVVDVMQKNPMGAADSKIGTITAKLGSWSTEFELKDPINNQLIATFVNPPGFWDTSQKILDCKDNEIATITWKLTGEGAILHRYTEHKVFDPAGNHIADLHEEDKATPKGFLSGFTQTFIYLRDTGGKALASMRHPEEGFKFMMLKGDKLTASIDMLSFDMLAPRPSMDPEFLSLVFANNLANGNRFGPGFALIGFFVWTFLFLGCCCVKCCSSNKAQVAAAKAQEKVVEEKEGLLATRVNSEPDKVQAQGRSMFACCSRRAGEASEVKAPAPK